MRRMDRYEEEENPKKESRSLKNQELYESIGSNTKYTNLSDIKYINVQDLSNLNTEDNTRENYQRLKDYSNIVALPKVKKDLEDFKTVYKEKENRVYDINSAMAEARKNRVDIDEKESKRKLKNDKYNILLSMTPEELEEYRKERKEKYTHPDEEEIDELIDTIASKTLAGELDKQTTVNLLSELMATSIMDRVDMTEEITENTTEDLATTTPVKMSYEETAQEDKEIEEKQEEKEEENPVVVEDDEQDKSFITSETINPEKLQELKEELDEKEKQDDQIIEGADSEFYTRSMDLSEKDFDSELADEFVDAKIPIGVKLIIALIVIAVIASAAYFIWKMMF